MHLEEPVSLEPRWRQALPLVLILGLVLAQQIPGILGQSATFDEVYHVSAGYVSLRAREMRWMMLEEHTPLIRQLVALPLLWLNPQLPRDAENRGEMAHRFFFDNTADPDTMLFLARLLVVGLTLLLVCGVHSWARELWGQRAGLVAAFVAALDPNLIAHGQLATTDVGAACFSFLAVYAFWRFLRRPSTVRLAILGLVTGFALASKFSAVVVVPMLALLGFLHLAGSRTEGGGSRDGRWLLGRLLVVCLIAMLVLILDYGGEFRPVWAMAVEMRALGQGSAAPPSAGPVTDFVLTRLPIPVPSYWYGLWLVGSDVQAGRSAFLWGQRSETGWWTYFPVALLIKTPLATLVLVAVALASLSKLGPRGWSNVLFLILPAAAWLGVAMASRLNLGYRHVLSLWPFLFVLVGRLANVSRIGRVVLLALLGWLAVAAVAIFPHHLAYFNELVGGPGEGYRCLVDSNLDWGQDLKRLAVYREEHHLGKVHLAYFGTADPDYYGIEYECMPSYGLLSCDGAPIPRSGTLAVSATCLQGGCTGDPTAYHWLLGETPVAKVGYSIFIYRLP